MNIKTLAAIALISAALVGCESGKVVINADSTNNSIDNSVNNSNNTSGSTNDLSGGVCATYTDSSDELQAGRLDGDNCIYETSFVDFDTPITQDLTLGDLGGGAHIFKGSVFVGENYSSLTDSTAAGIMQGGDGATLTIESGAVVALRNPVDFIAVMRGSQIIAQGTPTDPIVFTSEADVMGQVDPEQVQSWAGI